MGVVNTTDLPEASFRRQRDTRKKRCVLPKWNGRTFEERAHSDGDLGPPDFPALFPGFDHALVTSIVAETSTWEDALRVLLALADDTVQCEETHQLPSPDTTDELAFPPLVDSDGWQVISEIDTAADTSRLWCEVAKDISCIPFPASKSRLMDAHKSVLHSGETSQLSVLEEVEVESEYDCKQRRGIERRLNQVKNSRCQAQPNKTQRTTQRVDRGHQRSTESPAWRLCRFEDRL